MKGLGTVRRLDGELKFGLLLLTAMALLTILVPVLSPFDPVRGDSPPLLSPSAEHLFGTDNLGRDLFARSFAAIRLDLRLAVSAVALSVVVGTLVGATMGMASRSKTTAVLGLLVDSVNAFPFIVLALGIVAVLEPSPAGVLAAIVLTGWARYARIARTRTAVVADADYIHAARLLGYGRVRIMLRHVFPNVSAESFAFALSDLVVVVLAIAALSFLGAGVRPPTPELGAMISEGRIFLTSAWWISIFPGVVLATSALSINFISDGYDSMRRRG